MTTMTEPRTALDDAPLAPTAEPAPPEAEGGTGPAMAGAEPQQPPALRDMPRMLWPVAVVAVVGGLVAALVGFGLSYRTLVGAARGWGFGERGSVAFPLGVDGAILAFYALDLILVWRQMPKPLLRIAAHGMTGVTIVLNVTAAAGSAPGRPGLWEAVTSEPGRLLSHAAMPVVFVLTVEGVRHLITRTARLETGTAGTLTLHDWLLNLPTTWAIFKTAKVMDVSYAEVREQRRELAIHRVWLAHREEIEAGLEEGRVSALDRLPELLAPHGVTVEEALALPDKMRREEEQRRATREAEKRRREREAEQQRRAAEHADKLAALAAEAEELRAAGEVDVLRAQVEGEREAAAHRARAAAGTASIEASAAERAAERAAAEADRMAEVEQEARESARAAADRRKAAEDTRAALRIEEENIRRRQEVADAKLKAAGTEAEAQHKAKQAKEDAEKAAQADLRAKQAREAAARAELAAVAAEDAAGLTERERNIRRVARLVIAEAGGDALRLPLSRIETTLRVANGTASGYRSEAAQLLASGYDPSTDPLHAVEAESPWRDVRSAP